MCHGTSRFECFEVIFSPFVPPQRSSYGLGCQNFGILSHFPLEQRQIKAKIIYRQKKPIPNSVSLDIQF